MSTKTSKSIIINRLKASLYALATLILAGWITDTLNESLMFRPIIRLFYPEEITRFVHPFDDTTSFIIWFVPLMVGLLIMLGTSMLTVKHIKKRHLYHLSKQKPVHGIEQIIFSIDEDKVNDACKAYHLSHTFHFIVNSKTKSKIANQLAQIAEMKNHQVIFHEIKETNDLFQLRTAFEKTIQKICHAQDDHEHVAFDLSFASSLHAGVALFSALELNIGLTYVENNIIRSHEITCEIDG